MRALADLLPAVTGSPSVAAVPVLSRADAYALLARPPGLALEAALETCRARVTTTEVTDPLRPEAPPRAVHSVPALAVDAVNLLPAARSRLAASRAVLEPASMKLRSDWALCFANAVERRFSDEKLDFEVETLAGFLDLPAVCFLGDVDAEPGETPKQRQFRSMVVRVRYAAKATGGWWASYGKLEPILAPFAHGLRAHVRQLGDLVSRIEEMEARDRLALASSDRDPDPASYLEMLECQPADHWRRRQATAFRSRLAPEQLEPLAARLAALCDIAEPVTRSARLPPRPHHPDSTVARQLAQMAAERHAQIRQTVGMDDEALRRLAAEKAALVDLSPPPRSAETSQHS